MEKFLITRDVPHAGRLAPEQLQQLAAKSNAVLAQLGGRAQWVHSYVTSDNLFCVYYADDEAAIREHARIGGFPCDEVRRFDTMIDPTTAVG